MLPHIESDTPLLQELARIPTKAASAYLRLSDVCNYGYGHTTKDDLANILAIVAHVSASVSLKTASWWQNSPSSWGKNVHE